MKKPAPKKKLDPRQIKFLACYLDPKGPTFGNATQSALEAGFGPAYAKNITGQMPVWLSENISNLKLLIQAEKNLMKFLKHHQDPKLQLDVTKFVARTLGNGKYNAGGRHVFTGRRPIERVDYDEEGKKRLQKYLDNLED